MKSTLITIAAVIALALITTSSAAQLTAGYSSQLFAGEAAPRIPIVNAQGRQTSLTQVSKPIVIVAFADTTNQANSSLTALANSFKHGHVTVVQVTSTAASQAQNSPVLVLQDKDNIVSQGYKNPAAGSVFLINGFGNIRAIGTLKNLDAVARQAKRLNANELSDALYESMLD